MSAFIYGNCERCGQLFTVEEDTHHVTFLVGGKVVSECPVCGDELTYPSQISDGWEETRRSGTRWKTCPRMEWPGVRAD